MSDGRSTVLTDYRSFLVGMFLTVVTVGIGCIGPSSFCKRNQRSSLLQYPLCHFRVSPFEGISTQACTLRGTVSLYVQLSAPMRSYAGFGLAVRAVCWTWPPLALRMPRSVHSLRHRQLCAQLEAPSASRSARGIVSAYVQLSTPMHTAM